MRAELKRLLKQIGSTTIYVTHDQVEALSMGDRIAVMRSGKLVQVGDPLTIYNEPVDQFVGGFIGSPPMNFLPARVEARDGGAVVILADAGELRIGTDAAMTVADFRGRDLLLGIRAENVEVEPTRSAGLRARVLVVEPLGSHNLVTLRLGQELLKATTRPDARLATDQEVGLVVDAGRIRWLDAEAGIAIDAQDAGAGAGLGAPTSGERDAGTVAEAS
jgi:multiple sugar transport system ATP-binding protein